MIIDSETNIPDYEDLITRSLEKAWRDTIQEAIRNCDNSKLLIGDIKYMIGMIEICESHLDLLVRATKKAGGFCSAYPKRCLEELYVFKTILVTELKNDH